VVKRLALALLLGYVTHLRYGHLAVRLGRQRLGIVVRTHHEPVGARSLQHQVIADLGGRVVLEVMRLAPERVVRMALLDTGYRARAAGAAGEAELHKRMQLLQLARSQGVRAMASTWVQDMVDPTTKDALGKEGDGIDRPDLDAFA